MKTEARILYDTVIAQDYCIGCGACAAVRNSPFKMEMDQYGNIVARPESNLDESDAQVLEVCPFSDKSKNEDAISEELFHDVRSKHESIGKYLTNYAGAVNEEKFRSRGSSGGLGKWLGYTLLQEEKIDYFIQVVPNQTNDTSKPLFDYQIFGKDDDVLIGSKSSYYPVHLANVFEYIREHEGRYAITGVPCFIKTIRLMCNKDEQLTSRIKYTFGVICGGMKSANHSKMIGWQLGIKPENLVAIDFRRKYKDKPAKYKIYQAWSNIDDKERYKDAKELFATDYGSGYFKPNACDYCDDVVGETSDISIGDAWLPGFEEDPRGNTITVVRNKELLEVIERHIKKGTLSLTKMTAEDVARSQAGGLRHRRDALSYRIAKKEAKKQWYPPKRVKANEFKLTRKRKRIYALREKLAQKSHTAFVHALQKDDLNVFYREMKSLAKKYHNANYGSLPVRGFRKIKGLLLKYLAKVKP